MCHLQWRVEVGVNLFGPKRQFVGPIRNDVASHVLNLRHIH